MSGRPRNDRPRESERVLGKGDLLIEMKDPSQKGNPSTRYGCIGGGLREGGMVGGD